MVGLGSTDGIAKWIANDSQTSAEQAVAHITDTQRKGQWQALKAVSRAQSGDSISRTELSKLNSSPPSVLTLPQLRMDVAKQLAHSLYVTKKKEAAAKVVHHQEAADELQRRIESIDPKLAHLTTALQLKNPKAEIEDIILIKEHDARGASLGDDTGLESLKTNKKKLQELLADYKFHKDQLNNYSKAEKTLQNMAWGTRSKWWAWSTIMVKKTWRSGFVHAAMFAFTLMNILSFPLLIMSLRDMCSSFAPRRQAQDDQNGPPAAMPPNLMQNSLAAYAPSPAQQQAYGLIS